jgi:urease accessory protein
MAGGDPVRIEIDAGPGAQALVTSQSQEKIYRADGVGVEMETRLRVASGARLVWAPQETLLLEGARLSRRLEADVDPTATLTIFEAVGFGRLAHGETSVDASLADRWRIRRDGRLVFAEALRIENAGATLDRPAIGSGARALATLLRLGPEARERLDPLREALAAAEAAPGERLEAGASVVDGVLVARLASPSPQRLRAALIAAWGALEAREPPRVWQ